MVDRVDPRVIPPSISDERALAFGKVMQQALADPDFKKLLFERVDTVDASVLPFLVREFSMEEFIEPGMQDDLVRGLLKEAFELHAMKGFLQGVRRGLELIGIRIDWKQWFEETPQGMPGTHTATVYVNRSVFKEQEALLDERTQRAALRMIDGMKRWSQDVGFRLGALFDDKLGAANAASGLAVAHDDIQAGPDTTRRSTLAMASAASTFAAVRILAVMEA